MSSKKKKPEEHENHERWMVSYADLVTLLFAFFVVMYAANRMDQKSLNKIRQSIQLALRFEGSGGVAQMSLFDDAPSEGGCVVDHGRFAQPSKENKEAVEAWKRRLLKRLKTIREIQEKNPAILIEIENNRIRVRLSASSFFDSGSVELKNGALPLLETVAQEMAVWHRPIRVEGHTDDLAVSSSSWRSNWELSAFRASSVVRYLEERHAVPSSFLTASGMGPSKPLVPNDTPENREANRRIELLMDIFPGDALSVMAHSDTP